VSHIKKGLSACVECASGHIIEVTTSWGVLPSSSGSYSAIPREIHLQIYLTNEKDEETVGKL
jgi:hypothetical protein